MSLSFRFLRPLLLAVSCLPVLAADPPKGLAANYPEDKNLEDDPAVLLFTNFESDDWKEQWAGGNRKTVTRVERDPARKFEAFQGQALAIVTPEGEHYGASIEFPFAKSEEGEPSEIYFRYYLRFGDNWDPVEGGKLPGIGGTYGKAGWGGRPSDGKNGWSARGLFKTHKEGKTPIGFYCYHAEMKGKYGDNWLWERDQPGLLENNRWYCLEQYAKLNTMGKSDGILRAWIDGKPAFEKTDVRMRNLPDLKIEKIWINFYHGGGSPAASEDHAFIDNVVISKKYVGPMVRKSE